MPSAHNASLPQTQMVHSLTYFRFLLKYQRIRVAFPTQARLCVGAASYYSQHTSLADYVLYICLSSPVRPQATRGREFDMFTTPPPEFKTVPGTGKHSVSTE